MVRSGASGLHVRLLREHSNEPSNFKLVPVPRTWGEEALGAPRQGGHSCKSWFRGQVLMCQGSKSSSHSIERTRRSYRKGAGKGLSRQVLRFGGFLQHKCGIQTSLDLISTLDSAPSPEGPLFPGTVGTCTPRSLSPGGRGDSKPRLPALLVSDSSKVSLKTFFLTQGETVRIILNHKIFSFP